jgi:ribonucleoside-triphosphate reductase
MIDNKFIDTRSLMSEAKFHDGYSRYMDDKERYETWEESVDRVISMHEDYFKNNTQLQPYLEEARGAYKKQLVLAAQRSLQFGGDQLLKHEMKMYNCTSSYADREAFFGEFFYILLCGAGAGFSVQRHHVAKIADVKARKGQAKTHVATDDIEGWAECADVLLSSYFEGGGKRPDFEGRRVYFDLTNIRRKGTVVAGNFKAPGPEPLRIALDQIEHLIQTIILAGESRLRPIHVYDICMFMADAVLAGGVRRSATICLFSPDDMEMMEAKSTPNWHKKHPQRARSNNSALIVRSDITKEQFNKIITRTKTFGEPGFVFSESTEFTVNPCVEIGMYPQIDGVSGWQGCNLTEINGGACSSEEIFYEACRSGAILGTIQAAYTNFKFLGETTKKIFEREALLGVSITGWMNNPKVLFDEKILQRGAAIVKEVNREVAAIIGINPAARTTCVKPSGNASVLLKTASGIHPDHSPMFIRNVTLTKDSEVAKLIKETNPHMVEDTVGSSHGTDYTVSFPVIPKQGSMFRNDAMGVDHLALVKKVQKNWVLEGTNEELCAIPGLSHNVSNTITVQDWDEIEEYIFDNREFFAGISLLGDFGDKDFNQAPNTEVINAEQMVEKYGTAAIFASGLVVDGLSAFNTVWDACLTAQGHGEDLSLDSSENATKRDWVRRFKQFADNYLEGDLKKTEYCLKDSYLFHKWNKIQNNFKDIQWSTQLGKRDFIDINTLGAAACVGNGCEIDF